MRSYYQEHICFKKQFSFSLLNLLMHVNESRSAGMITQAMNEPDTLGVYTSVDLGCVF